MTYSKALVSYSMGIMELTGTEEQHQKFEELRTFIDETLFPRFIKGDRLVKLAKYCGLSVKIN